ncbi:hypothetical protein [Desulfocurvibacter africanus]|uniref:hypothetical protein n=1 Tax=Desulfocurvibacter africanus TaxID=873 RepID=UPI0003FCF707|nr:hypothetical protein [Desulfocurvibacter africanus]
MDNSISTVFQIPPWSSDHSAYKHFSPVTDVDAIHFILDGKVAESGSHEELV